MFYDRFEALCQQKGVKPNKACVDMGLSRSLAAKWKATKTEKPSADVLEKMSVYFNMSIDEILGKEESPGTQLSDEALMFALFGNSDVISAEDLQAVKSYAAYLKSMRESE